jgi:hypothetical protein
LLKILIWLFKFLNFFCNLWVKLKVVKKVNLVGKRTSSLMELREENKVEKDPMGLTSWARIQLQTFTLKPLESLTPVSENLCLRRASWPDSYSLWFGGSLSVIPTLIQVSLVSFGPLFPLGWYYKSQQLIKKKVWIFII